jgi:hypothetical protein
MRFLYIATATILVTLVLSYLYQQTTTLNHQQAPLITEPPLSTASDTHTRNPLPAATSITQITIILNGTTPWKTFAHDYFPWIVRYPSNLYERYDSVTNGDLELSTFDAAALKAWPADGHATITISGHPIRPPWNPPHPQSTIRSFLVVAGESAIRWDVDEGRGSDVSLEHGGCYYLIWFDSNLENATRQLQAKEDFRSVLDQLRFDPLPPADTTRC